MAEHLSKNGKNGKNGNGASVKMRRTPPPHCGDGREYGQGHLLRPSISRPPPPEVTRPEPAQEMGQIDGNHFPAHPCAQEIKINQVARPTPAVW
ncbi:hypothetical protein DSM43518_05359 [Mycobacterium marinum]|uniref:Uncharacterized protein n=1 Tax=Mycobacterium marinum TaxID=1781 RepID=A0A2Z5YCA1_MYCMR|nr:hypothetical protein [Mycobacterium marinum]AXN43721.1 hypothetical protein MM1218R_01778 [Mycobacterium marinum]AXN49089.1 hypothetical protein CCUG20998_01677 [Mycobacterium marinum]EPQ79378.1 hypothetical protein MMEU_5375 [Mycobacterium marinum str. Europe]RFZ02180.1 hypothetical protein DSM43518_05359 [Mycobacterium marinum]RFZ10646.1 hypothetical protein DE4381_01758 [Mycobacterium marinum]